MIVVSFGLNAQNSNQDDKQKEFAIIKALLENNWEGSGILMRKEATFSMEWQRVLNNKFMKLEFHNKRKSADNENIVFKATAFYKIVNDTTVIGNWFDNRGVTFPLNGSVNEHEMTILWGNEETEMGKTIYSYSGDHTIAVEDFILSNGEYYKFGSATYNAKD